LEQTSGCGVIKVVATGMMMVRNYAPLLSSGIVASSSISVGFWISNTWNVSTEVDLSNAEIAE
jgi:hypothetical protein